MNSTARKHVLGILVVALMALACACAIAWTASLGSASNAIADEGAVEQDFSEHSLLGVHEAAGVALDPTMELTEESCVTCHADYVEVTAKYNCTYNPHGDHDGIHYPNVKCHRCHSMTENPVNWCTTCHTGLVLGEGWQALPLM